MAKKVRVQFGQVKEQAAESAMVDEALQLEVGSWRLLIALMQRPPYA